MNPAEKRKKTINQNKLNKFSRKIQVGDIFGKDEINFQIVKKSGKRLKIQAISAEKLENSGFMPDVWKPKKNCFIGEKITKYLKDGYIKVDNKKLKLVRWNYESI